ncbi:GRP family sugar transporter [Kingella negevensis]|nr:GRP family sugar transporter [Kingella negevensis]MDK4679337.1 GRP family sugar transporter [Kingella negevensis]MDK4682943.1 GRP family sugar transporter [Kingella negevensis]MDK4685160.1 GRP family sugar transporter [Kingella negevensis]MDK4691142.1 GRP family sugar transporter [Kingella negevensis]MDK4693710.1 GRP family sugar transporter [Kingella negevensis]
MGQIRQLQSIKKIGVAYTMPMSTGMQLVTTTLFGTLVLGEWNNPKAMGLGIAALLLILAGVYFTSAQPENVVPDESSKANRKQALMSYPKSHSLFSGAKSDFVSLLILSGVEWFWCCMGTV